MLQKNNASQAGRGPRRIADRVRAEQFWLTVAVVGAWALVISLSFWAQP